MRIEVSCRHAQRSQPPTVSDGSRGGAGWVDSVVVSSVLGSSVLESRSASLTAELVSPGTPVARAIRSPSRSR